MYCKHFIWIKKKKSVNSLIPDSAAEVKYTGIQEAVDKLMSLGSGALMAKFDIKRAYRLLPVNTNDRSFLGMKWKNNYYIDLALPFGLRSAPKIFTKFADVLEFLLLLPIFNTIWTISFWSGNRIATNVKVHCWRVFVYAENWVFL